MDHDLTWLNRPLQTWFRGAELRSDSSPPQLNCQKCSRADKAASAAEKMRWQNWKCCTFQPFVPNYLLGAMLERGSIQETSQAIFTPLGLCPSTSYRTQHATKKDEERGEDLICSFFDRQSHSCTNWESRPSECATYFCKESPFHIKRSQDLFEWEIAVAQMAMIEMGAETSEVEAAMSWMEEDFSPPVWQVDNIQREEFYRASWLWAKKLQAEEILAWLPIETQARFESWISVMKTRSSSV